MATTNIIISGVGGQGLVLGTKILAEVAFKEGFDMKSSDVIGLSQRGGMVWGSVRFGEKVGSAVISEGECDILLALEQLEGLRWSKALKKGAKLILNNEIIYPNRVLLEKEEYPENIGEKLEKKGYEVINVDAKKLAKEAGNAKASNTVLLGVLSKYLPFSQEAWIQAIKENVPPKTIEMNIEAFKAGRN